MDEEPIILYIGGVYKKDALSVNFFAPSDTSDDDDYISPYDQIPLKYTGLEYWPLSTNILCRHCCLSHNNPPVFIPEYFTTNNNSISISILRMLFCSFPCAAAYITNNYTDDTYDRLMRGLKFVYFQFTNIDIDDIPCSPYPEEIDIFGGADATYTVIQFQQLVNNLLSMENYLF